jgi:glycosyltransferase involved in cell wall biosynthesis
MRRPLRLVLTVERYAPLIGGAERVVQRVGEGLVARGHDVIVVTTGRRRTDVLNGVRVERFPVRGNSVRGIRGDVGAVLGHVEDLRPDVVFNYAAQTWHADAYGPLASARRPYRLVLAPCGYSALHDPDYSAYFARMRAWLPHYDALVFHSSVYRDWEFAVSSDAPASAMHVIPNAADDPPPRRPNPRSETVFVTVGSHVRSKGHGDFIEAVRSISSQTRARGVVVAPPRRGRDFARGCQPRCFLESLRPHSPVRFTDGRPAGAVERELAEADVFLFASQIECAPIVILEAMAAGVPWVSYDVGNVRELAGGIVVEGLDELVAAGARLARTPREREELAQAGQSAWRERHRWPGVIDAYEQLFLELAAGAPVGAANAASP